MCPCIGRTPCFRSNWVFREVTPVSQRLTTDYRERWCWKTIPLRVEPVKVIESSTKGFLEILSNVLFAQERSQSFTYGKPEESCSSFTLMYFGNRRASR